MGVKDTANLAMIPAAYAEDKVYSVLPSNGDGDFTFTRTGSGTRINKGGYIETMAENVPRLNYRLDADGNPKGCPELLLEEQRTNSITNSEDFSAGSWNKNNSSITTNDATAPDGTNNADKITSTGTAPYARVTFTHSTLTSYAVSIFAKKGNENYLYIRALALSSQPIASFNLNTGSLGTVNTGLTAEMQNYGNGWYRCVIKYTTTSSISNNLIDFGFASSDNSRFSSSGKFTYFWGAQIETGSYPTSYIPTSGGAITRNVDSAYNQPFGDLASDYPITVYWKGQITNYNAGAFAFSIYDNGSNVRYLGLAWNSTSNFYLYRRSTSNDADLVSYTTQIGDVKKIAIKFTSNTTAKVYIDGIEVYNLSSGLDVDWDFDSVLIGQQQVISDGGKRIPSDELFVWNKALTDAEMVEITTP